MRKIALVFPGQGSQYLGMFNDIDTIEDKRLLDIFNIASNVFNQDFLQISLNFLKSIILE